MYSEENSRIIRRDVRKPLHNRTFQAYVRGCITGAWEEMTQDGIAKKLKVSRTTIIAWDKRIDWDEVLTERRKLYAKETVNVDIAMVKKAKAGDVRAIDLYYQRFDNWVPTSKQQSEDLSKKSVPELDKEIAELEAQRGLRGRDTQAQTGEGEATA